MSRDDFESLTDEEFEVICKVYFSNTEAEKKEKFSLWRLLTYINTQPHIKKTSPEKLFRFWWEEQPKPKKAKKELTTEEEKTMIQEMRKNLGW